MRRHLICDDLQSSIQNTIKLNGNEIWELVKNAIEQLEITEYRFPVVYECNFEGSEITACVDYQIYALRVQLGTPSHICLSSAVITELKSVHLSAAEMIRICGARIPE